MAGAPTRHAGRARRRAFAALRLVPLVTTLALGLTLAGCDHCGDYFWSRPGACKGGPAGGPAPN
jgi:hypothetical protein